MEPSKLDQATARWSSAQQRLVQARRRLSEAKNQVTATHAKAQVKEALSAYDSACNQRRNAREAAPELDWGSLAEKGLGPTALVEDPSKGVQGMEV